MDFGKRIKRGRKSKWIWHFLRIMRRINLISDYYEEHITVIGNTFICNTCALTFDSQDDAFKHVDKIHAKIVTPFAPD